MSINSLTMGDIGNYTCSAAKDKFVTIFIFFCVILFMANSEVMTVIDASNTVPHITLLVSSGNFTSGLDFFLSPPENKKAFAL